MSKPEKTGSRTRREKAQQAKQWRHRRAPVRPPPLQARRATVDPQPAPTARSYFVQQIWDKLGLTAALEQVGIEKDGLPLSTILIVVLLMGVVGATSLFGAAQLLPTDAALCTMLAVSALDEKQIYRGLAGISLVQYQAWMSHLLGALQADPRTASRPDGVVASDSTQVAKRSAHKIPGVHILFLHSEKQFACGAELLTTHYADGDKDYPLFLAFYEPDAATVAARAADKARRAAEVDGRQPAEVLAYIEQQVAAGNPPTLVTLSGPRLNPTFTEKLTALAVPWLGVSDGRRTYTLAGQAASQTAKMVLATAQPRHWEDDADLGDRFADLGLASSRVGAVRLVLAEHMADGVRTLYLTPATLSAAAALARITLVLEQEQAQRESGILHRTLELLRLSRLAGIRAETATFDRWYFVPWFIQAVLGLGFQRVVIKAKAGCKYTYRGQDYDLDQLWPLLTPQDFEPHERNGRTYRLAALPVQLKGVGPVKLVFVRQPTRRGDKTLDAVLLCTDVHYANPQVLRAYLLRWRIEIVFTQMTKGRVFACGGRWDHVTDFHRFVVDDDAVNQQLYQLSALGEIELLECRLQAPTEIADAGGELGRVQLLLGLRLQLTYLLRQAALGLGELLPLALELGATDDLGQVDLEQARLLALQLGQHSPQGTLAILQRLGEPLTRLGACQFMGDEGRICQ